MEIEAIGKGGGEKGPEHRKEEEKRKCLSYFIRKVKISPKTKRILH